MNGGNIAGIIVAASGFITAVTALWHSIQTRKQVRSK